MNTYPLLTIAHFNALPAWDKQTVLEYLTFVPDGNMVAIRLNDSDGSLYGVYNMEVAGVDRYLSNGGQWTYTSKQDISELLKDVTI